MANMIMNYLKSLRRTGYVTGSLLPAAPVAAIPAPQAGSHADLLDMMLAYYESNDLYEILRISDKRIKSVRNPVAAFVGFYEAVLWPDPLVAKADSESITVLLAEASERGNWGEQRARAAHHFALYGEMFIKTQQRSDGTPYNILIDPRHVRELDRDERGFITWIRIEKTAAVRSGTTGKQEHYRHVEVWEEGRQRVWRVRGAHDWGQSIKDDLGAIPTDQAPTGMAGYVERAYRGTGGNTETGDALTIDFVPIAYSRFRASSDERGLPPILTALEDIDEANALASNMHRQLRANRPDKKLTAPAANRAGSLPGGDLLSAGAGRIEAVQIESDEVIYRLPAGYDMQTLISQLDYGAMRQIVEDQMHQIVLKLPELDYYQAGRAAGANASAKALFNRLLPALTRAGAARAAALACMVRANQHLLTIGQRANIAGYGEREIGVYEAGNLAHTFQSAPILPRDPSEKAEEAITLAALGSAYGAMRQAGYSAEETETVVYGEAGAGPQASRLTEERESRAAALRDGAANEARDA